MNALSMLAKFGARLEEAGVIPENPEVSISAEVSATVDRTTPEEELTIAEAVTQAEEIASTEAEIEAMTQDMETATNQAEMVMAIQANIRKYNVTPQSYDLLQNDGILSAITLYTGTSWPATESLSNSSRNYQCASDIISGCESMLGDYWKKVKSFFKELWNKIKELVNRFIIFITTNEKKVESAHKQLDSVTGEIDKIRYPKSSLTFDDMKIISGVVGKLTDELKKSLDHLPTMTQKIKELISRNDPTGPGWTELQKNEVNKFLESDEFLDTYERKYGGQDTLGSAGFTLGNLRGNAYECAKKSITSAKTVNTYTKKIEQIVSTLERDAEQIYKKMSEDGTKDSSAEHSKSVQNSAMQGMKSVQNMYRGIMMSVSQLSKLNMQCVRSYIYACNAAVAGSKTK